MFSCILLSRYISARRATAAAVTIFPPLNRIPSPTTCESNRGSLISFSPYRQTKEKGKRIKEKGNILVSPGAYSAISLPPASALGCTSTSISPSSITGPSGVLSSGGADALRSLRGGEVSSTKSSASRPLAGARPIDVGAAGCGLSHRATTWPV